jgi:hypothetical protein
MCKGFLIFGMLCGLSLPAFTQQAAYLDFPHAIGIFVMNIPPEVGLQYQQWIGEAGFQVVGGIYYSPEAFYNGRLLDYWIEAEGMYRLYGDRYSAWFSGQLYLWARLGHEGYIAQINSMPTYTIYSPFVPVVTGGVGVGIEVILFQHFSFPFEFGYDGDYPFGYSTPTIGISISGGFRYRF